MCKSDVGWIITYCIILSHTVSTFALSSAGQFFRKGVEIDETRMILILPGKEPVPVMRRPVWSFMEREVSDDQLCWTAMNPGYQGEGLIEGVHQNYIVDDVLDSSFVFEQQTAGKTWH